MRARSNANVENCTKLIVSNCRNHRNEIYRSGSALKSEFVAATLKEHRQQLNGGDDVVCKHKTDETGSGRQQRQQERFAWTANRREKEKHSERKTEKTCEDVWDVTHYRVRSKRDGKSSTFRHHRRCRRRCSSMNADGRRQEYFVLFLLLLFQHCYLEFCCGDDSRFRIQIERSRCTEHDKDDKWFWTVSFSFCFKQPIQLKDK